MEKNSWIRNLNESLISNGLYFEQINARDWRKRKDIKLWAVLSSLECYLIFIMLMYLMMSAPYSLEYLSSVYDCDLNAVKLLIIIIKQLYLFIIKQWKSFEIIIHICLIVDDIFSSIRKKPIEHLVATNWNFSQNNGCDIHHAIPRCSEYWHFIYGISNVYGKNGILRRNKFRFTTEKWNAGKRKCFILGL